MGTVIAIAVLAAGVLLITQRWFWVLGFFTAALASGFAMLASIVHFQILWAVGFFFLMIICWGITANIVENSN
jgi:hypothetical protein